MAKISLEIAEDPSRTEFGAVRTTCACRECTINCEYMPGYLIPADLKRIAKMIDPADIRVWAVSNLRASPGAKVAKGTNVFRIPTLVPARSDNGWCKFLQPLDSGGTVKFCTIHENSPFGCAFFDSHHGGVEVNILSHKGLNAICSDVAANGLYSQIWLSLVSLGLTAQAPEESRALLRAAYIKELADGKVKESPAV